MNSGATGDQVDHFEGYRSRCQRGDFGVVVSRCDFDDIGAYQVETLQSAYDIDQFTAAQAGNLRGPGAGCMRRVEQRGSPGHGRSFR